MNNPIKETKALVNTLKIRKIDLDKSFFVSEEYNNYQSKLVNDMPLISIIIPTLNRYRLLKNALMDLEMQNYKHFEVIVIDQSDDYNAKFYQQFNLDLKIIRQSKKALWSARNLGIKKSISKYILLFDDDSRVDSDWIIQHLKCLLCQYLNVFSK